MPHKVVVLADVIDPKSDQRVDVVLLSDKTLDATKVDVKRPSRARGGRRSPPR